jgi:hypothetical protein
MTSQATVAKLLIDWFDAVSPNWSPTTASQTRSVIDHHLIPWLGRLPLQRLRTEDIDALYGEPQRSGGPDGRPLTANTVHRIHVVLHRALEQALRWEWLWVNPASHASPPSCKPAPVRPPSPDEVVRLLGHVSTIDLAFHACRGPQLRSPRSEPRDEDLTRSALFPSPICQVAEPPHPSKSSTRLSFSK